MTIKTVCSFFEQTVFYVRKFDIKIKIGYNSGNNGLLY